MSELFRDTVAGFFVRAITKRKFLQYPEEISGFKFPIAADVSDDSARQSSNEEAKSAQETGGSSEGDRDIERGTALQTTSSHAIHPVVTKDGIILVDWYSEGRYSSPTL